MTQYNGRLMAANRQAVSGGLALDKKTMATQVFVDGSIIANDTLYFGKLPKGAIVSGGRIYSGRFASGTSAGSCSFSLCLGFDQGLLDFSGTAYSTTSTTSAFGVWGPIDYNIITSNSPMNGTRQWESGFTSPLGGLLVTKGPLQAVTDGNIYATVIVSAGNGSGVSSFLNLELDYYMGTQS